MPRNTAVQASDFARNFAKYQDEAIAKKVINVTRHGRIVGAYLSAAEFAHYELLKRRAREILIVGDLDEGTIASIEAAEYGEEPK